MYRSEKKQLLGVLESVADGLAYVVETGKVDCLADCILGIRTVCSYCQERCPHVSRNCWETLQSLAQQLEARGYDPKESDQTQMVIHSHELVCTLYQDLAALPCKRKVLFLPYMAAMWTSLESIWKAAQDDPDCEVAVVPIPYHKLSLSETGQVNMKELVYEGHLYPNYVPVIHYQLYDIQKEQPDAIFIHNPYDGQNSLTQIPPQYYSSVLREQTDCLVFSSYGIIGDGNTEVPSVHTHMPAYQNADFILCQSQRYADLLAHHGVSKDKLLALGSPKIDHILHPICPPEIPPLWREKTKGKKVVLVNIHLSFLLTTWVQAGTNKEVLSGWEQTKELLETLLNTPDCAVIWRPHPLLENMLESRGLEQMLHHIRKLKQRVSHAEHGILDDTKDYLSAFALSDVFCTTFTSLIYEYMATKKPIFVFDRMNMHATLDRMAKLQTWPISMAHLYEQTDYLPFYSDRERPTLYPSIQLQIQSFLQMVLEGRDPLKEDRLEDLEEAFYMPAQGTCGEAVWAAVKESMGG